MTEINPNWRENVHETIYQVFEDQIEGYRISTIYLRPFDEFETMVFGTTQEYQERCKTLDEAHTQHVEAINYVKGLFIT